MAVDLNFCKKKMLLVQSEIESKLYTRIKKTNDRTVKYQTKKAIVGLLNDPFFLYFGVYKQWRFFLHFTLHQQHEEQ